VMRRSHSAFTPVFSSRLAPVFAGYVGLKRALGRRFDLPVASARKVLPVPRGPYRRMPF
jgi:hypothetical protein